MAATGASNKATSSASLSSASLVHSDMWDMLPDTEDAEGVVNFEVFLEWRAVRGEGEFLDGEVLGVEAPDLLLP